MKEVKPFLVKPTERSAKQYQRLINQEQVKQEKLNRKLSREACKL